MQSRPREDIRVVFGRLSTRKCECGKVTRDNADKEGGAYK